MSSPALPVTGFPLQAHLRATAVSLLVIAALAIGFLWSSGHDDQRCVELVMLALMVPLVLARTDVAGQIAWMSPASRACLGAFFILGAVSTLHAFSLRHGMYEWSMLLSLLLATAALAAELFRTGARGMQILLRGIVVVGILHSLRMALMYAATLEVGVQADMHMLAVGFSNARFLNHAQTALLPLAVLSYLHAPTSSGWRRASFGLAAFWWAFLFLSEARASILALGVGCMFAFALRRKQAHGVMKAMALTALAGVAVYLFAFVLLPVLAGQQGFSAGASVIHRTAADPTSSRTLMWRLCLELIAAHPMLGVGPHHFAHESSALGWGAHPHDFILQVGAEWGVPALLCLLAAIGIGMRGLVRSSTRLAQGDAAGQQTLTILLAAGMAILVDGLFSGVLVMPQSQMAIMLYLGFATAWVRSLDKDPAPHARMPLRWLGASMAVAALCGLVYAVAPSVERHASHAPLTLAEQAMNPEVQWPRLWEAGHF